MNKLIKNKFRNYSNLNDLIGVLGNFNKRKTKINKL